MSSSCKRWSSFVLGLLVSVFSTAAATPPKPLHDIEVLALVAGGALPVNVTHEIAARGLDFLPTEVFRSQLKAAGADATILSALKAGKVRSSGTRGETSHQPSLQHLAAAAKLMHAKKYDAAAVELNAALGSGLESPSIGFAMGEILSATERYSEAVAVYAEVLKQNPNFPEAHTKLSYNLYRTAEPEEAAREAKLALAENSGNPEAHKNLALAYENLHKFEAAAAEYQQTLRLKPDYVSMLRDLGRNDEAAKLAQRTQSIQAAQSDAGKPN